MPEKIVLLSLSIFLQLLHDIYHSAAVCTFSAINCIKSHAVTHVESGYPGITPPHTHTETFLPEKIIGIHICYDNLFL